jgi:hypothetical protein
MARKVKAAPAAPASLTIAKAIENGDGVSLAALVENAYTAREECINILTKKELARALVEYDGREVKAPEAKVAAPREAKVTKAQANVIEMRKKLEAKGPIGSEAAALLDELEAMNASKAKPVTAKGTNGTPTAFGRENDGTQKAFQEFLWDCMAEHFERAGLKDGAKAIMAAKATLIKKSGKRPLSKDEKAAAKAEQEAIDGENIE